MGKIVSVYEYFGLRTTFRNELSSWTEVWLYYCLPRQQWLRERDSVFHYTYIACLGVCLYPSPAVQDPVTVKQPSATATANKETMQNLKGTKAQRVKSPVHLQCDSFPFASLSFVSATALSISKSFPITPSSHHFLLPQRLIHAYSSTSTRPAKWYRHVTFPT